MLWLKICEAITEITMHITPGYSSVHLSSESRHYLHFLSRQWPSSFLSFFSWQMTGDFDICWWSNAVAKVQIQQNKSRRAHAECLFSSFVSRQTACLAFKTSLQSFSLLSKYCWWCELDVGSRDAFSTESRDLAQSTRLCAVHCLRSSITQHKWSISV